MHVDLYANIIKSCDNKVDTFSNYLNTDIIIKTITQKFIKIFLRDDIQKSLFLDRETGQLVFLQSALGTTWRSVWRVRQPRESGTHRRSGRSSEERPN